MNPKRCPPVGHVFPQGGVEYATSAHLAGVQHMAVMSALADAI